MAATSIIFKPQWQPCLVSRVYLWLVRMGEGRRQETAVSYTSILWPDDVQEATSEWIWQDIGEKEPHKERIQPSMRAISILP